MFQSDLKWLMLLCFPCCRSLPCCRQRGNPMNGSPKGRYHGGVEKAHYITSLRRHTEPPAVIAISPSRRSRFQLDASRRPTPATADAACGMMTTARVNVHHPPSTPQTSGDVVHRASATGSTQMVVLARQ